MSAAFRNFISGIVVLAAVTGAAAQSLEGPITPKARWLAAQLQSLDVEHKWIAGAKVDWKSGLPNGQPETRLGGHTHCSAFVASAAQRLGVYILSPPQHRQELLANAQSEWLPTAGRDAGWLPLAGAQEAQDAANLGDLVVASYHNHYDDKPGHIAIVLPSNKNAAEIAAEGPDVMQAATVNSASISIKAGFAGHLHAWRDQEIRYYAHPIEMTESE